MDDATKHGFLLLWRRNSLAAVVGDGTMLEEEAAKQYYLETRHAAAFAEYREAQARHDEALQQFECTTRITKVQAEGRGADQWVEVIRFPGGATRTVADGTGRDEVRQAFLSQHPEPRPPNPEAFWQWWRAERRTVRIWEAALVVSDTAQALRVLDRTAAVPHQDIVRLLDELAAEGWDLMHVSQDNGVYDGEEDARAESAPVCYRFLLARATKDLSGRATRAAASARAAADGGAEAL